MRLVIILLCFIICWMKFQLSLSDLTVDFYAKTCSQMETVTKQIVKNAIDAEPRMAASLLRLHFHDCFVQGCDASILLDGTDSEKTALPNNNSARGYDVIDQIKAKMEQVCPGVVSCADILAVAARDSVVLSGGPNWDVKKGRRDSTVANKSLANNNLPGPTFNLSTLLSFFERQGLNQIDLVALSGAHTIGKARCITFKQRLYGKNGDGNSDPTLNTLFLSDLKGQCPASGGDDLLSALDTGSTFIFDNSYFLNIQSQKVLFASDQALYSDSNNPTMLVVDAFAEDSDLFASHFASSMVKMGDLGPVTGDKGEIRKSCRSINSGSTSSSRLNPHVPHKSFNPFRPPPV